MVKNTGQLNLFDDSGMPQEKPKEVEGNSLEQEYERGREMLKQVLTESGETENRIWYKPKATNLAKLINEKFEDAKIQGLKVVVETGYDPNADSKGGHPWTLAIREKK